MLGQLSSLRRRGQRLTQDFFLRGIATQKQVRRNAPSPPTPPEKIEWWAVDGELFKAEKFDPKRVLAPLELDHISNKRRRKELIRHLRKTRLKLKLHNQNAYWADYMQRFQILRDEWEKHVWDPPPVPQPKRRNPAWLAEETQKYVWQDPRREAYTADRNDAQDTHRGAYTFDLSRMDQSAARAKFDEKIGYKRQAMSHSPYENKRNPGASTIARSGNFPRRNLRPWAEPEEFEEVFNDKDTDKSNGDAKEAMLSTTEDEAGGSKGELFNWDESESEEGSCDEVKAAGKEDDEEDEDEDEDDDDSVDDESETKDIQQRKKGWFGDEDDLFKDDE